MQYKLSAIAAALAVAGSSAFAAPLNPNVDVSNYTSGTTDVYLAGSSAIDLALTKFIANTCAANTLDAYRTDAGGKTYYLWTCSAGSGSAWGTANTKIAIHKNTNSSSDGTNAVANGAAGLAFLQVSDLTAATDCAINPTPVPATSTIPAYNLYVCGTTAGAAGVGTLTHTVRFGFSDSEPKQFNSAVASQLTSSYPVTVVMGIPVTKNVRDALQAVQGLGNDETEANMPSLSAAQINSILTGNFSAWSDLGVTLPGSDQTIYVGRRSAGSGTTRAIDETFVGTNCVPGATPLIGGTALSSLATSAIPAQCTGTASGGSTLNQLGTSDDMASCLSSYQANGVGAVGYLSTDYTPATADGYRWIKVDGYAPKQLNVVNGSWKAWSEESLNFNTATPLTGDDAKFYAAIKATSANGTLLSELGQNLRQTTSGGWVGGVLGALPNRANKGSFGLAAGSSLTAVRTDASVLAYPANPATRANSLGYNLCNVPLPASGFQGQ